MMNQEKLLRSLPKVDEAISYLRANLSQEYPAGIIKKAVRDCIEDERRRVLAGDTTCRELDMDQWAHLFQAVIKKKMTNNLGPVINGTGVVIHTNLGRSLLSVEAGEALVQAATCYTNLEFDLQSGRRGSRYSLVEAIICELTGAEAALVVNNNAAAVLLVLETLARGKEVIVSRGQLVEIGGSFRIPDVMAKSGANMVEVGATNRTHLKDYQGAMTDDTALLLKVHCSNFRVIGFTKEVAVEEMVALAAEKGIGVMEDLGSGCLLDLSPYGLPKEPTVQEVVSAGVDVVTFSGDKLLGGPQAGIIVGKRSVIERIKTNPMNRALRIDKFTLAALETILRYYYDTNLALKQIPTLNMLTISPEEIRKKGRKLLRKVRKKVETSCLITLVETRSKVGGGAMPEHHLPSWGLELQPLRMTVSQLEKRFRSLAVPIIGRIENDRFLLDMRTIQESELADLAVTLINFFSVDVA